MPGGLGPEGPDRPAVAWYGVVGEVSSHHACQPSALLRDGLVPASLELVPDLGKFGPHSSRDRDALERKPSAPRLPADVRESKKSNVSGLPRPRSGPALGGEPTELDEARLVGVPFEVELRESLAEII